MAERPEPERADVTRGAQRLEAFSDAVIAVIITLLAFQLAPPSGSTWADLTTSKELGSFSIYVLSFVFIAIYWNNHHHLLRATTRISGAVMWANMLLLFCLSLVPVATEWLRADPKAPVPVAAFGVVALAAAISYTLLVRAIVAANGRASLVGTAIASDVKGYLSLAWYAAGVGLAAVSVWLSYASYVLVAVIWLVPDRRFTRAAPGPAE